MLPAPVSFQRQTGILSQSLRFLRLPRASARLTSPDALLSTVLALSVLLNLRFLYYSYSARDVSTVGASATPTLPLRSIVDTLPARSAALPDLDHLIVVPGHSIWVGVRAEDAEVENGWLLGDYQKGRASPSLFRAHIARG
jgi:hypothetical protein